MARCCYFSEMFKILVMLVLVRVVHNYNILGIFPNSGKSHFLTYEPLLQELTRKGHNVTVLSEFPQKHPIPRYTDIVFKKNKQTEVFDFDQMPRPWIRRYLCSIALAYLASKNCEKLSEPFLQELVHSKKKFDVVIVEYFNTECFLGFVYRLKTPFMAISSSYHLPWQSSRFGNPDNPAYIPIAMTYYSDQMSFIERVDNTVRLAVENLMYKVLMDIPGNRIARKYFGENLPPLVEISKNVSVWLINTHPAFYFTKPQVPTQIDVQGLFLKEAKKLPQVCTRFYCMCSIKDDTCMQMSYTFHFEYF